MYAIYVHLNGVKTIGLFPRTRAAILASLLLQPERSWYLRELARHLDKTPSSLQAELATLTTQGVLLCARRGKRVHYQANRKCPYFEELQGLVAKTSGIAEVLRSALEPLADRIHTAFVHGSIATGTANASSDIDIFVIGDVTLTQLARVLPHAAVRLGRPVNPTLLSPADFRKKRRRNRFVKTVLSEDKLDIIGSSHALGGASGSRAR